MRKAISRSRSRIRAEEIVSGLSVRTLAIAAVALISLFAILGAIIKANDPGGLFQRLFELGGERNAPALFSAALLVFAAGIAYLLSSAESEASRWRLLAGLYIFIALDETFWVHERLQLWTGVDWQVLYLPVAAAAVVIYLRVLPLVWPNRVTRAMFLAGTFAWAFVWLMEALRRVKFFWIGPSEEIAEMVGSLLFGLALLVLLQYRNAQARAFPGPFERSRVTVSGTPAGVGVAEAAPLVLSRDATD
jgi:hypothetical protein